MSNIYRFVVLYNSKDLYIWILIQLSIIFIAFLQTKMTGNTKQSRLESTTEIAQNKHVKVLHYFVDDIK